MFRWPWTRVEDRVDEVAEALVLRIGALESRVSELSRRGLPEEPTGEGLPSVVRAAIDAAIAPWDEDRQAIKVRGRLIRGARVRLRAGQTDATVASWVTTGEDQ